MPVDANGNPTPYVMGTNPLDPIIQRIFDRWTPEQLQRFMNNPAAVRFFEEKYGGMLGAGSGDPNNPVTGSVLENLLGWQAMSGYQGTPYNPNPTPAIPDESGQVPPPTPTPTTVNGGLQNMPVQRGVHPSLRPDVMAANQQRAQQVFAQAQARRQSSMNRGLYGYPGANPSVPGNTPPAIPAPDDLASAWKPPTVTSEPFNPSGTTPNSPTDEQAADIFGTKKKLASSGPIYVPPKPSAY